MISLNVNKTASEFENQFLLEQMELSTQTDSRILSELKTHVCTERKITQQILEYLAEVERRMLHAKMGYSSLFDFCTRELGYSEGATQRRISAMRLLRQLPELKAKLEKNEVNLSTLSQLKVFISRVEKCEKQKLTPQEKSNLVELIQNKSQKECERALVTLAPAVFENKESQKLVSQNMCEIKFYINSKTQNKVTRAKNLLSHVDYNISYADLFDRMLEEFLRRRDPLYIAESFKKDGVAVYRRDN